MVTYVTWDVLEVNIFFFKPVTIDFWFVTLAFNDPILFLYRKIFVQCILHIPNGLYSGYSEENIGRNVADVDIV